MTWPVAALLMTPMICYTLALIFMQDPVKDFEPEIVDLQSQINSLKANYQSVQRLADETQKMLSQANMAKTLTLRK